jgi:hypothetical protein
MATNNERATRKQTLTNLGASTSAAQNERTYDKAVTDALVNINVKTKPAVVALTNASVAHALNATFSDTEVEAALNALGAKVNTIIAALKA